MKRLLSVLGLMISITLLPLYLMAQGLDPSFGNAGIVTTNFGFGSTYEQAQAVAIQPDGKIIAAGGGTNGTSGFSKLARYNINGDLDPSFGPGGTDGDGKVSIQVIAGTSQQFITDIALLPGGSILAAGYGFINGTPTSFIIKLNSDGSPSTDFTNGVIANMSGYFSPLIELQTDGKIILILLKANAPNRELRRLNSDGNPDLNFGGVQGGVVNVSFDYSAMIVAPSNEIFICGGASGAFMLVKYSSNGNLLGSVATNFNDASGSASAIALQPDGKIVVAGQMREFGDEFEIFAVARYTADGSLDNSFSGDGMFTQDMGAENSAVGVIVQADNKIVVGGYDYDPDDDDYEFLVSFRLLENGTIDPCYGQSGSFRHGFGFENFSQISCLALQSDGRIIFGGFQSEESDFILVRYADKAWYLDADKDGYYTANLVYQCTSPGQGYVDANSNPALGNNDCDDNDSNKNPGKSEICDGKDNDCDGVVDEDLPKTTYYTDADGDGYGSGLGQQLCSDPGPGHTTQAGDCNDNNANVHPGAGVQELCDGIDNDCDGVIDEGCSGKPNVSISDVTVYESEGKAVLTISLSHMTTLELKVNCSTSDGTAVSNKKEKDYKAMGNTMLTIPPGTLTSVITIPVYIDSRNEANEYFYVNLTRPTNCIITDPSGVVTILDGAPAGSSRNSDQITKSALSEPNESSFEVKAYPNPSASGFTLQIDGSSATPADVWVFNSLGQLVKRLRPTGNILRFGGELNPGIYIAEIRQGVNRKTLKLVKQ